MLWAAAMVVLAAAPGGPQFKVGAPGLTVINQDEKLAEFYVEHLAGELSSHGLRVVTAKEISTLMGLEQQKQLLGCSDTSTSCLIELANALGVDGVLTGEVARFGSTFQIQLKIVSAHDATPLARFSGRARSEEALIDELSRAAGLLVQGLGTRAGPVSAQQKTPPPHQDQAQAQHTAPRQPEETPPPPPPAYSTSTSYSSAPVRPQAPAATISHRRGSALRTWAWVPATVGVISGVVGVSALSAARKDYRALTNGSTLSTDEAGAMRDRGSRLQTIGWVGLGIGALGLATGGYMFFSGDGGSTGVALVPGPGAGLGIAGAFP